MYSVSEKEMSEVIHTGIENKSLYIMVEHEEDSANYGMDEKPNFDYCKNHNIPCYNVYRRGGAIYTKGGDISIARATDKEDHLFGERFVKDFTEFLKSKGLNAENIGNDILVDGYKVYGWSSNYFADKNVLLTTLQISISIDLNMIKKVCLKPMIKVPKGLSEWGLTKAEVIEFIKRFNHKYSY